MAKLSLNRLTPEDHTAVVDLVIKNRSKLAAAKKQAFAENVLRKISKIEPDKAKLLARASAGVSAYRKIKGAGFPLSGSLAREAIELMVNIHSAPNVAAAIKVLRAEAKKKHHPALSIGIDVSSDIVASGMKSIYNSSHWVAYQVSPEGGVMDLLESYWDQMYNEIQGINQKVLGTLGEDLNGAMEGALDGWAGGGPGEAAPYAVGGAILSSIESIAGEDDTD
ncbi:hypothetical protein AB0C29_21715 [Actinoplanes sp. NPDC048791]|uniref:hypothetical protein n=1 Tax=Actinoplanes sp. NPDC048791 TaxID=3154623 RepID=UPI00340D4570